MATNGVAEGKVITYANSGSAISANAVVVVGQRVGIATVDIAASTGTGAVALTGVWTVAKTTSLTITQGDLLYWDTGTSKVTKNPTDIPMGYAWASAASAATTVEVLLAPAPRTSVLATGQYEAVFLKFDCSAAAASITLYDAAVPFAMEIAHVWVQCTSANASGTIKLTDGSTDITDAIACATDKAIDYAASIDNATSTLAAGDSLVAVKNAAADQGTVYIIAYRLS